MERGVGGQRGKDGVMSMTVNELLARLDEIGTTGEEQVVFEPNHEEYMEARHVFRDDGQIVISNCPAD